VNMSELKNLVGAAGANDVHWTFPALPGQPLLLRAARPKRFSAATPVLFVHHGVLRNGGDYRDFWLPLVDEADVLVIVPEFSDEAFPGVRSYNFGNRTDEAGAALPRAQWTYGVDAALFEALREAGVTRRRRYGEFGHSAGGQFVHRMISLGFRDHVAAAVTANAGTYAVPTPAIGFPYGLGGTRVTENGLRDLLSFRMTVMAGTADVDATSEHFPREEAAMRQGPTRYARAHNYIGAARAEADRLDVTCAWTIVDVEGVGHDGERMSAAAAPILAAALHAAERIAPG
jgi:hypothetical protein